MLITQLVSGLAGLSASSDISQGSVATCLKSGGIYSDSFITNYILILTVKSFENRLIFDKIISCTKMVPFLAHPVHAQELLTYMPVFLFTFRHQLNTFTSCLTNVTKRVRYNSTRYINYLQRTHLLT